ncbi:MAG: hypothetical protein SGILL_002464 [Bacillariaceae sp.]
MHQRRRHVVAVSSSVAASSDDDHHTEDTAFAPQRRSSKRPLHRRRQQQPHVGVASNITNDDDEHDVLPFQFWKWLLQETPDARKINEDENLFQNDSDVSMTLIVGAVVFVAALVLVALLVLLSILFQHESAIEGERSSSSKQKPKDEFFVEIPSSTVYTVPNSMAHIGDKSSEYASLRKDWDMKHPPDVPERSLQVMQQNRDPDYDALRPPSLSLPPYDMYNCPKSPHPEYPHDEYPTVQLLKHWPPSQSFPRDLATAHLALCVFDYGTDYAKVLQYRKAEVPFVVRNDPRVAEAVERWTNEDYRSHLLGDDRVHHRAEKSDSLHFLYWRPDTVTTKRQSQLETRPPNWTQPTTLLRMTYQDWDRQARQKEEQLLQQSDSSSIQHYNNTSGPYFYYRLIGCGETGPTGDCDKIQTSEYLFDELTFFQPRPQQLYLTEPDRQRGIHCRFGMPGIMAENHFDSSRNAIVVLGGQRRYILSHPKHCSNLALFPLGHPSARHSQINWTEVAHDDNDTWRNDFPEFGQSMSNEVVLQAGDVLYLPTNWFHSIISLSTNFQCNTRSGRTSDYDTMIDECGFGSKAKRQ